LIYTEGRSQDLVEIFYGLQVETRRRHGLPPQPLQWFHNLTQAFGDALKIRVAFSGDKAVAAILTLQHKDTLVYKYGASDARFSALAGTHLLLWESIKEAKRQGLRCFDLGRSDWSNGGLITFKKRWGAAASELKYFRLSTSHAATLKIPSLDEGGWGLSPLKRVLQHAPRPMLRWIGERLYRHIA
jgi:lipid II:glycine glycyltransferase (peptidoglycan interpeptide bridge formation enzyme)